jgi:hypothetical protein
MEENCWWERQIAKDCGSEGKSRSRFDVVDEVLQIFNLQQPKPRINKVEQHSSDQSARLALLLEIEEKEKVEADTPIFFLISSQHVKHGHPNTPVWYLD